MCLSQSIASLLNVSAMQSRWSIIYISNAVENIHHDACYKTKQHSSCTGIICGKELQRQFTSVSDRKHTHTHEPRKLPTATPTASAGAVNHRLQQGQPTFSKPLRRADLNSNTTHHAKGLGFHHAITACPPLHSIRHHAGWCPQKEVPPTTPTDKALPCPLPLKGHDILQLPPPTNQRGDIYRSCLAKRLPPSQHKVMEDLINRVKNRVPSKRG